MAAAMAAVFVPLTMIVVVRTGKIGRKFQRSVEVPGHHRVNRALHAGNQLDPLLGERLLRPGADSAADQDIHTCIGQK